MAWEGAAECAVIGAAVFAVAVFGAAIFAGVAACEAEAAAA